MTVLQFPQPGQSPARRRRPFDVGYEYGEALHARLTPAALRRVRQIIRALFTAENELLDFLDDYEPGLVAPSGAQGDTRLLGFSAGLVAGLCSVVEHEQGTLKSERYELARHAIRDR